MCFQLFEVAKAVENVAGDADKFKDFSLMLGMGMEAVVLGWTVAAFQSRMSALSLAESLKRFESRGECPTAKCRALPRPGPPGRNCLRK